MENGFDTATNSRDEMKRITVKNEDQKVPTEIIAESIVAIAQGFKKLRSSKLNDKALFLLIQHSAPTVGQYPSKKLSLAEIKAVFDGIDDLEKNFFKKAGKDALRDARK